MQGLGRSTTLRDISTGYGLFSTTVPEGWTVIGSSLGAVRSSSKPYIPQVELHNEANGAVMRLDAGPAGTRNSTGMNLMTVMYGAQNIGIDTTNYADMPDPSSVVAEYALQQLRGVQGVDSLHFDRQVSLGDPAEETPQVSEVMRRQLGDAGGIMPTGNPFVARTLHLYRFNLGGAPWKMAVFARIYAAKLGGFDMGDLGGMLGGLASSLGDAMGGIGEGFGQSFGAASQEFAQASAGGLKGLLEFGKQGGLVGAWMRNKNAADAQASQQQYQPPQQAQLQPQPQKAAAPMGCTHDYATYSRGGTIIWSVETLASYIGPETDFDKRVSADFLPLALNAQLHPDVLSLITQFVSREAAAIQGATNVALANKQVQFQAQQAAHRQQQAAFDSYNQAWQARSDAHHQQFRAATNAQFATPAPGSAAPDYSEAIRGVNTYTTSDGREVEVSVQADRAWENQSGDVIGTSGGFDPGADWTQLPRT